MFSCWLFKDTGFNAVNIPDGPDILINYASIIVAQTIDVVDPFALSTIRVKVTGNLTRNYVPHIDYICVGNPNNDSLYTRCWYSVTGFRYTSHDVVEYSVLPDWITTIGGVSAITSFQDGIAERYHVPSGETYGQYTEPDPLMAPSEAMTISGTWVQEEDGECETLIESSLDLTSMASSLRAYTYKDPGTNQEVAVPAVITSVQPTQVVLKQGYTTTRTKSTPGTTYYKALNTNVAESVTKARSLGVENGITAQYRVPLKYATITGNDTVTRLESSWKAFSLDSSEDVSDTSVGGLAFIPYDSTAYKNLRLAYSDYTPYHILTACGNDVEFIPADIRESDTGEGKPHICYNSDPRSSGRPYYRFQYYKGSEDNFFLNCVAGEQWEEVPIVYQGKSGAYTDRMAYASARRVSMLTTQQAADRMGHNLSMAVSQSYMNAALQVLGAGLGINSLPQKPSASRDYREFEMTRGATFGITDAVYTDLRGEADLKFALSQMREAYRAQSAAELELYAAGQSFVAPEIRFPLTPSLIRDYIGNGAYVYRLNYGPRDLARIDKLLTMYGYADHAPLEPSMLTSRTKFNYVKAGGVVIGGYAIPRFMREGVSAQLSAGVRIWHKLPDPGLDYVDNPPA